MKCNELSTNIVTIILLLLFRELLTYATSGYLVNNRPRTPTLEQLTYKMKHLLTPTPYATSGFLVNNHPRTPTLKQLTYEMKHFPAPLSKNGSYIHHGPVNLTTSIQNIDYFYENFQRHFSSSCFRKSVNAIVVFSCRPFL
jgi:hypothetical protein